MLYGAGQLFLQSKDLDDTSLRGENLVHPLYISAFELTFEDNNIEAKALIDGKRQIKAAAINESIATLTLTFEYQDWNTLGMAFDELPQTSSNVNIPMIKSAIATSASPGDPADITDAEIVGTEVVGEDIFVYVASKGDWGDRKYLEAADVTVAAGQFSLPTAYDGAVIEYTLNKSFTSIDTIGIGANYDSYGKLVFNGVVSGTEFGKGMGIIIPELNRISTPQLTVNGDLAEMTVEFRCGVPAGKRRPFELYNLDTGVEA